MKLGEAMKHTKESVGFEHPAKGPHHCSECAYFLRLIDKCREVQGKITAPDWCRLFKERVV